VSTIVRLVLTAAIIALVVMGGGCASAPPTQPEPGTSTPAESDDLLGEVNQVGYSTWATAPGYDSPQPAKGPHGDSVQIFLSPSAEKALAEGASTWPTGSIIVKDVYQDGARVQLAAMKKTDAGWYWGEWDDQGIPVVEGIEVEPCQGCHVKGTDGTLAVELK